MLFTPAAHEAPVDESWSAERVRTAIASTVADTEAAFDDGWAMHPRDVERTTTRLRGSGRCISAVPASSLRFTASRSGASSS